MPRPLQMERLISKKKLDEGGIKYKSTHEGYRKILNYVSLSLTDNNPMIYSALKENRITNPIIIRIDSEVLYLKYTIFYKNFAYLSTPIFGPYQKKYVYFG